MNTTKEQISAWAKDNKAKLVAAGAIVCGTAAVIAGAAIAVSTRGKISMPQIPAAGNAVKAAKNQASQAAAPLTETVKNTAKRLGTPKSPHDRVAHLRLLPQGMKASSKKVEEAAKLGISLLDRQTLVKPARIHADVA